MSARTLLVCCALVALAAVAAAAAQGGAGPGAPCTHPGNCSDRFSNCHNNTCECYLGYEVNGTNCTMKLNFICDARFPCNRAGAECINSLCVCKRNYVVASDNKTCVPVAGRAPVNASPVYGVSPIGPGASPIGPGASPIGPGASPIGPGASPIGPGASPIGHGASPIGHGASPIGPGASPIGPGASPITPGASPIGPRPSPISPGVSPIGPGAHLPPAYGAHSARPTPSALGQFCRNDSNCTTPHSVCRAGACGCADGFEQANRTCVKRAANVYDSCVNNESCHGVPNTTCHNGRCVCLVNYFPSSSRRSCEHMHCRAGSCSYMGYATCRNSGGMSYCSCIAPDFIQDENKCYKEIGTVGAKCDEQRSERCYLSADGLHQHVECRKGKCQCRKNYKADKRNKRCIAGASAAAALSALVFALAAAVSLRA